VNSVWAIAEGHCCVSPYFCRVCIDNASGFVHKSPRISPSDGSDASSNSRDGWTDAAVRNLAACNGCITN
jgi:hypothetical protein